MSYRGNHHGGVGWKSGNRVNVDQIERVEFTTLPRLPAILTDVQAGWLLGFPVEAIGILVREGLLVALGSAGPDDAKRFAAAHIEKLTADRDWLDRATDAIYQARRK